MANIKTPIYTKDLIEILKKRYPDVYPIDEENVTDYQRGKYAGVIELIRELEKGLNMTKGKN